MTIAPLCRIYTEAVCPCRMDDVLHMSHCRFFMCTFSEGDCDYYFPRGDGSTGYCNCDCAKEEAIESFIEEVKQKGKEAI